MKAKLIIFLLTGIIIGMMLGGIMAPVISAQIDEYYPYEILKYIKMISSDVSDIRNTVSYIYYNMP